MKQDQKVQPLRAQDALYRHIFDTVADGLIVSDLSTGLVVEANRAAAEMHGYSREEFIGLDATAFIHRENHYLLTQYAEAIEAGKPFETLAIHLRRDGSSFNVEWRGTTLTYEGQKYLLFTVRDVSQRIAKEGVIRKLVEERTQEQSKLLEISEAFASALEVKPG